jgi:hypothetical protein
VRCRRGAGATTSARIVRRNEEFAERWLGKKKG